MTSLTPEVNERATGEDRMLSSSRFSAFLSRLPLFAGVLPPPPPPPPPPPRPTPQSTPKDNDGGSRTQRPGHPPPLPPPPPPPLPPPASSPLKTRRPAETCSDCGEISSKNASLNVLMEALFEEYKRRERRSSIGRRSEDTSTQEEEEEEEKAIHCSSSSSSSSGGGRRPKNKKRKKKKKVNGLHPSSVEPSSPSSSSFSFDLRFQRLTNGVTAAVHSSVAVSDECLTDAKDRRQTQSRGSLLQQQPLSYGRQVRSTRAADRDGLPGLPVRRTGRVSSRQFVPPRATGDVLVRSRSGEPAASQWNIRGSADRRSRSHDSFGSKEKRRRQTHRGPTDPTDPNDPTDPTDCSRQRTLPKTSLSLERQKSRDDRSTTNRREKQREEKEKAIGRTENGKGGGEGRGGGGGGEGGRGGGGRGGGEKVRETSVGSSSNGDVHWLRLLSISSNGRNSRPTTTNKREEEASREKTQKRSTESNERQSRIPLLRTTERQQLNTRRKTTVQQQKQKQHNSCASESDNNNDTPSPLLLGEPQAIVISNDSLLLVGSLSPINGQPEVERIPLPLKLSRLVRSIATRHLTQRRSVASASAAAAARGSNGSSSSQSDAQWPY